MRCRFPRAALFALFLLALPNPAHPVAAGAKLLQKAGAWCLGQIVSYGIGKGIDRLTGQDFEQQLKGEIPRLVKAVAAATGPERKLLQENLDLAREQLGLLSEGLAAQGARISELRGAQERLNRKVDDLASRIDRLERQVDAIEVRVDQIDERLTRVEDALLRECLDLRQAPAWGSGAYRVRENAAQRLEDHTESESLDLSALLLLDACTSDLTQRGLLIQLTLITRGLDQDLSLYVNWKGIGGGGPVRLLTRQEIPLARPIYRFDGQVAEIFLPYNEIPFPSETDRVALALVLTHDGEVLYTLPDEVVRCVFGQRVNCRWGR